MFRWKRKIGLANKKSNARRVNVPNEILEFLGAETGDHLWFNVTDDKKVVLTKANPETNE